LESTTGYLQHLKPGLKPAQTRAPQVESNSASGITKTRMRTAASVELQLLLPWRDWLPLGVCPLP
jgi:hypothetical protein